MNDEATTTSSPDARDLLHPLLDQAVLAQLRTIPGERTATLLGDLILIFIEDSAGVPERVRELARAGDSRAVELECHRLRGSAGALGAGALREVCQQLEQLAHMQQLAAVLPAAGRLEQVLQLTTAALLAAAAG